MKFQNFMKKCEFEKFLYFGKSRVYLEYFSHKLNAVISKSVSYQHFYGCQNVKFCKDYY